MNAISDAKPGELAKVIDASRDSYAALSHMLDRTPHYLRRFVTEGIPRTLRHDEHRWLADFGLTECTLGIRNLWTGHP